MTVQYYVFNPKTMDTVWMPNKESAIGLVNTYHKLGVLDADYYTEEIEIEGIPF